MIITVRSELEKDYDAIGRVHSEAFGHTLEAELIQALRKRADFSPDFSLVAENEDHETLGHVLFTRVSIEEPLGSTDAVVLAPLAVFREFRGHGAGKALVNEGIKRTKAAGHRLMLVNGYGYYTQFGFAPARDYGIFRPNPRRGEQFLLLELTPGAAADVRGVVKYPPEFEPLVNLWYRKS